MAAVIRPALSLFYRLDPEKRPFHEGDHEETQLCYQHMHGCSVTAACRKQT